MAIFLSSSKYVSHRDDPLKIEHYHRVSSYQYFLICNLKSKIFSSTIKCKSIPGTVVHDLGGIDNEVKLSKSKSMKLKMHKIEVFVFDENHQFFSSVFVWFFKHHKAPSQKH